MGEDKVEESKIFVEDYSRLNEIHKELAKKISDSNISVYIALGILESLKQEIILGSVGD